MDVFSYEIEGKKILVYRSIFAPVKSNMYVLFIGRDAVVFDPNINDDLLYLLDQKEVEKVHILLTHGHYDHISGVEWLKKNTKAEVYCQKMCANRLLNPKRPLARMVALVLFEEDRKDGGHRYQDFKKSYKPFTIIADKLFDKKETIKIEGIEFKVTSTPGHTEGSACYELHNKIVFTGDTLLQNDPIILRFPGGNKEDYENISSPYLRSLPKDTIIMPGHGDPFILKDTKNI